MEVVKTSEDGQKNLLCVGDFIALRLPKPNDGWLSGTCVQGEESFISRSLDNFNDCLWEVYVQYQYSASREYEEALLRGLSKLDLDDDNGDKNGDKKVAQQADKKTQNGKTPSTTLRKFSANTTAPPKGKVKRAASVVNIFRRGTLEKDTSKGPEEEQIYDNSSILGQLHRAALTEQKLNENMMSLKFGKPVLFGDSIQLRHMKSKQYLTVSKHELARQERENMKVTLIETGNVLSGLVFHSRFKSDRDGVPIYEDSEILLGVHDRPGEFIHVAKRHHESKREEVNCSLESTVFQLVLYNKGKIKSSEKPGKDRIEKSVVAGQLVTLIEPDTMSCLAVDGSDKDDIKVSLGSYNTAETSVEETVGTNKLWLIEKDPVILGGTIKIGHDKVTFRDLNTGYFLKLKDDDDDDDNILGVAETRDDATRFSVNNSNQNKSTIVYEDMAIELSANDKFIAQRIDEETGVLLKGCCGIDNKENGVLSFLVSTNLMKSIGVGLYIGVENTATLRKFENFARSIEPNNSDQLRHLSSLLKSFFEALNTVTSFLVGKNDRSNISDLLKVSEINDKVTLRQTMLREQGLLDVLMNLIELCQIGVFDELKAVNFHRRSSSAGTDVKKGKDTMLNTRKSILQPITERSLFNNSLRGFITSNAPTTATRKNQYLSPSALLAGTYTINDNDESSDDSSNSDDETNNLHIIDNKIKPNPKIIPQKSSSLTMTSRVTPPSRLSGMFSRNAAVAAIADNRIRKNTEFKNLVDNRASVTQDLSKQCLRLLYAMILKNHPNQIHVASRISIVLKLIKTSDIAVACITEMFRDNVQILQEILSQREIDILMELLRSSPMNYTVLKLLQSICSCPKGVDGTQRMVAIALYQDKSDQSEVIETHAEYSRLIPYSWSFGSCYYPKGIDKDKEILGYKILKKGLPRILINWGNPNDKNNSYSTNSLYDVNGRLPLEILCRDVSTGMSNTNRKSIRARLSVLINSEKNPLTPDGTVEDLHTRRQKVLDYLITLLYTVGDMCLDRNYISIEILEPIFHYDKLLAILLNPQVSNAIKAPICRILRCMYVDREPQIVMKLPRLIRSSTEERDSFNNSLTSSGSVGSMFTFCLLQDVISKYLHFRLNGTEFDEYSAELTDLLQNLIAFGFYQTHDQLQDIMIPLITALDDHRSGVWHKRITEDTATMDNKGEKNNVILIFFSKILGIIHKASNIVLMVFSKLFTIAGYLFKKLKSIGVSDKNNFSARQRKKHIDFTKFDNGKGDVESKKSAVSWEKQFLRMYNNTIFGMVSVLLIVLVNVILTILSLFLENTEFEDISFSLSIYFVIEISLRIYCHRKVEGKFIIFFQNVFNSIDFGLVCIDWILYIFIDTAAGNAVQAAKGLRALRLLRLFRLMRAGRLVRKIVKNSLAVVWTMPTKYTSISEEESESIVNILKVLSMIYARIQEKRLGILIKSFVKWCDDTMNESQEIGSAIAYYFKVMSSERDLLDDVPPQFNELLLDIMMYSNSNLLQESLELLMVHNCNTLLLVKTAKNVQIIYSLKTEAKLKEISQLLRTLRTMAEKYEIWGNKEDSEKDYETMYGIIDTIISLSTKYNEEPSIAIRNEILADEEVQMLLKNLDAMACYMLVSETLFYQTTTLTWPVIRILQHCNKLICWFVEGSNENQQIAFRHIDWFIDRVDDGILSSAVIRSILRGNLQLIKDCPKRYIGELAEKILANGHIPDYLDLLLGLTEMSNKKDSSLALVRNTISRFLTSREWKANALLWCSAYESPGYYARKEAMMPFAEDLLMAENEMPQQLLYHTNLLNLLVFCNLGPKLQAVLYFNDVVRSLLDDNVIYPVRCALGNILNDMILNGITGIDSSAYMWDFVDRLTHDLEKYLYNKKKYLASTAKSRIQLGLWLETMVNLLSTFFEVLDLSCLGDVSDLSDGSNFKMTERSYISIQGLLKRLYSCLRNIIDEYGENLGNNLQILAKSAIENICFHSDDIEFELDDELNEDEKNPQPAASRLQINSQRASMTFADFQQTYYRTRFHILNEELAKVLQASDASPELFAKIPFVSSNVTYDVRLEPLLQKLTLHIRSTFKRVGSLRRVETASSGATAVWFVKSLRELLIVTAEASSKFTFDLKTFIKGDKNDKLKDLEKLCSVFNECGVAHLCIDLLANGITQSLRLEACKLLTSLLEINSFSNQTKETIYNYLHESESSFMFYEYLEDTIEQLISWTEREHEIRMQSGMRYGKHDIEDKIPEDVIIFELLQLSCSNNFMPMKDFMREQPNKSKQINILKAVSKYFSCLSRLEDLSSLKVTSSVMKTLIRLLQGPCKGNQEYLIMRTELLPSFNRFARLIRPRAENLYDEERQYYIALLQQCISDLANALIEEVPPTTPIYERICTSLELNMLNLAVLGSSDTSSKEVDLLDLDLSTLLDDDQNQTYSKAQSTYLKFLKTLGYGGQIKFSPFVQKKFDDDIQSVEVVMNDKVHSVYFSIPIVAAELHHSSLDKYMVDLDVSSQEIKLKKFLSLIRLLYKEAIHQTKLNRVGLSFMLGLKSKLTWLMFTISIILNALILSYYGTSDNANIYTEKRYLAEKVSGDSTSLTDAIYISSEIVQVIESLNLVQIFLAAFIIIIIAITAVPIHFQYHSEQGENFIVSVFKTALETTFMWYCIFFMICLLAFFYNHFILSGLLLDFVSIDSTIRDVLLAVQYPARQLFATLIIILIIVNVFAGIVFSVYRHDVVGFNLYDMWQAFKLTVSYGIRGEYGISYEMNNTLGNRLILDMLFYFIVLAILRHIFFAIIVDTFGKLRELKYEREDHRNNSCFICGADRHEFDKSNNHGPHQGFSHHRSVIHNVTNYIYFVILIWEQKREDDSGIEKHVRQCVANGDISWLPIGVNGDGFNKELQMTIHESTQKQRDHNQGKKTVDKIENNKNDKNSSSSGGMPPSGDDDKRDDISKKLAAIQSHLSKLIDKDSKTDSSAASLDQSQAQSQAAALSLMRERMSKTNEMPDRSSRRTFHILTENTSPVYPFSPTKVEEQKSPADNSDMELMIQSVKKISETLETLTGRLDSLDSKLSNIDSSSPLRQRRKRLNSNNSDDRVDDDDYQDSSTKRPLIRSTHRQSVARPWSESIKKNKSTYDSDSDVEGIRNKMKSITGPRKEMLKDLLDIN